MSQPVHVIVLRRFDVSAERVFNAWFDPGWLRRWMFGPGARDERVVSLTLDARVGGMFSFVVERQGTEVDHFGEYLRIDRPWLLVFTWATRDRLPESSRVIVEITPRQPGCELKLTRVIGAGWSAQADWAAGAWSRMLDALEEARGRGCSTLSRRRSRRKAGRAQWNLHPNLMKSENEQPGKFTTPAEVRIVRALPGPIERVWDYLVDPEKRARWFAGGPMEPKQGGKVELFFRHKNIAPDETPPEKMKHVQDPGFKMAATILRWEPPHVLSYTFDEDSDVTFELTAQGKNVQLVLTHRARGEDLPSITGYASGWHMHLAHLIALLEGTPRPPLWPMHAKLKAEYEKLHAAAPLS